MPLARFTVGTHSSTCSGCPACSEAAARLLADPTNAGLRAAVAQDGALRTNAEAIPDGYAVALAAAGVVAEPPSGGDPWSNPPDAYARGTLREAQASEDPNYQPHGTPPDGYALALAARVRP